MKTSRAAIARALGCAALFLLAVFAAPAAWAGETRPAAPPVRITPPVPSGVIPQADFWREIQKGGRGYVPGPAGNPRWLMRPIDKDAECVKAGKCTHRLVGFSLPIHEKMPPVRPPVGRGPTEGEALFALGVFGVLALAGLMFIAFRLSAPRAEAGVEEG